MSDPEKPKIPEKPRIIVDDDWKTRVQQEKESLRSGADAVAAEGSAEQKSRPEHELPAEASFDSLVSMLVTQALASLGQIPMGEKQEPVLMLDHAKHMIDLLGVLEQKTAGNLSAAEGRMLGGVLHELRMIYVAMQSQPTQ
jgi:hypothetical protein